MCSGTGDRTPKPLSNSPQGERATAALDYVNATPLELSGVRTSQHRSPIPAFPKGKEPHQTPLNTASRDSRPLGRVGEGLPMAINLLPLREGWDGATIWLFYRQRRLFDFVPFQPATGQARRWVVADNRESALGNICNRTQTHRAKP